MRWTVPRPTLSAFTIWRRVALLVQLQEALVEPAQARRAEHTLLAAPVGQPALLIALLPSTDGICQLLVRAHFYGSRASSIATRTRRVNAQAILRSEARAGSLTAWGYFNSYLPVRAGSGCSKGGQFSF